MNVRTRILSAVLALSLLGSLWTTAFAAEGEAPAVTGSISATLRLDYAQRLDELQDRKVQAELIWSGHSLAIPLWEAGDFSAEGCQVTVAARNADGGDLGGGQWPGYLAMTVDGLPQGSYTLRFTGRGYTAYEQKLTLADYAQHVILGTGDATFTLGDVDGNGRVNAADRTALAAALDSQRREDLDKYDLNGDGRVDIIDLAYVNRLTSASGKAEVHNTTLLTSPASVSAIEAELANTAGGTSVQAGSLDHLFTPDDEGVTLCSEAGDIVLPLPLETTVEMEEIRITSPDSRDTILAGSVTVEDQNGVRTEVPFDYSLPAGIQAMSAEEGVSVITVNLGKRVPVKKVTITVTKTDNGGYAAIQSIQFLKEIVPETPAAPHSVVKGLTADPGSEMVSLRWNELPNVSGYKVLYWPQNNARETRELHVDITRAQVTGLKNLEPYVFTVTPTDGDWEGKASAPVTATPQPNKVPDKTDMVRVAEMDGALAVSWKAGKSATYYEVYYQQKGASGWTQAGGRLTAPGATISGLTNDETYYIYVVAGNEIGLGPRSDLAQGTPKAVKYERPEGIPTQGILDSALISGIRLADAGNHAAGAFDPQVMIDDDYRTSWTAQNWWRNEHVVVTFAQPVDLSAAIWVPRLDGGYPNNLRAYSVQVWYEGESLNAPGHLLVPDPDRGGVDLGGTGRDVDTWPAVRGNPASTHFGILPFGPSKRVIQVSLAVEQRAYTTISLSELMFLTYDPAHCLPDEIAALFADDLRTRLADGVSQEQIDSLRARLDSDERNYYLELNTLADELALAQELLESRTGSSVILSGLDSRSSGADSAKYRQGGSDLQPLGVTAGAGQEITVYAQGIPEGASVTLYASQFNAEASAWLKSAAQLQNGRNVVTIPRVSSRVGNNGGSLYVSYSGADSRDIRLHIRRAADIPMLDLSHWYDMAEDARRDAIGAYVDELAAYLAATSIGSPATDYRNVTEIATPVVLLSLPAMAVNNALGAGRREEKTETLYHTVLAWEDLMHICKTTQGIDATYGNNDMQSRQNIRCMTMFAGAFMYAAGNHIGIGYGSCGGMVTGRPIALLPQGASANQLFGWGIAHEVGHNMDKLGKAEITNNIYSILVQTYDGGEGILPSRLEKSGKYAGIFTKVAQAYPGASNDVFVQLGMYWQLHLAYDGADPLAFYHDFFQAWKAGTYTAGAASYDDRVARTASAVAGRDLSQFFTRWGMVLSAETLQQLSSYPAEPRAIWYLNDQSRRARLAGAEAASGTLSATVAKGADRENEILLTLDPSGITGQLQGYEILRNGRSIAFVDGETRTFTDVIGSGNHRTYHYQAVAYDLLGNRVASADAGEIRVAYDKTVDPADYTVARGADGDVTFTMKRETAVSGLKLDGVIPQAGAFTVTVTAPEGQPVVARSAAFGPGQNQAADDTASFVSYFQMPGADADDTRIWTYDAQTVTVRGIPADVALDRVRLISYPGDDVAFLEGATMGLLGADYSYASVDDQGNPTTETIPQGTLVILGTYRGDPLYNTLSVEGRFTGTVTLEDGRIEEVPVVERPLDGYGLLFAEVPAVGPVSDISDGFFLFVPNVQREAQLQGQIQDCDRSHLLPSQIRVNLYRTDDPTDPSSRRLTAQTLWIYSPGGEQADLPTVTLQGGDLT